MSAAFDPSTVTKNLTPDQLAALRTHLSGAPTLEDQINGADFSGAKPGAEVPTVMYTDGRDPNPPDLSGLSPKYGAYDYTRSRGRPSYDPSVSAEARVAAIREAKKVNSNTPADFDQMSDAGRAAHWDRYFSGPPKPASLLPTSADFAQGQRPADFWKTYAAVRSGRPINAASAEDVGAVAGTGRTLNTGYGTVSSINRASLPAPAPSAPVPPVGPLGAAGGQLARGGQVSGGGQVARGLPDGAPVAPIPAVRPSLIQPDQVPDFEPGSNVSFPPTQAPAPAPAPVAAPMPNVVTRIPNQPTGNPMLPDALSRPAPTLPAGYADRLNSQWRQQFQTSAALRNALTQRSRQTVSTLQ